MELSLNRRNSTKLGLNDNEKYLQQHKIRIPDEPEKSRYTWLMDCDYGGKNVFRVNFIVYDWSVRGTFKSKAPLRVQFSQALGGEGLGNG